MFKKLPIIFYVNLIGISIMLLSSCYSYGPIHEPYKQIKITPPPPVAKKIGTPLSKSEYMQKTYVEIKNTLTEAEVKLIEDSIKVIFPNNIIYEKGSLLPVSEYQSPLLQFSGLLKKYVKTEILIAGHTDNTGDKIRNKELSRIRAKNILNVIVNNGIRSNRLDFMGVGDLCPIESNETDEGRKLNRRVEFIVLYRD